MDGIYSHTPSETILGEIPVLVVRKCLFSANIDADYIVGMLHVQWTIAKEGK